MPERSTIDAISQAEGIAAYRASEHRLTHKSTRPGLGVTTPGAQYHLTPTEEIVLRRKAMGDQADQIAHQLGIASQTVKNHLGSIYAKTNSGCLVDALRAVGWLQVPEDAGIGDLERDLAVIDGQLAALKRTRDAMAADLAGRLRTLI
jgi:DNA-binding CsgD family transcriptional regulator